MVAEQIRSRGIRDERVLAALAQVPRHLFIPDSHLSQAYEDHPLSIGEGQTISQPYMVALMTETLELEGNERILEIGTGSGYQTAILAELGRTIHTVERIDALFEKARDRLSSLGYLNVHCHLGDGTQGLPEQAPYDRILVTAGTPSVPQALLDQLSEDGILVAPVGNRSVQMLTQVERTPWGSEETTVCPCVFVPLKGQFGWPEDET